MNNTNTKIFKHEQTTQIIAIFFIQMCSATTFAVFYSGLSLFLTKNKLFSQESAAIFTGLFLSLNYFLPSIGGIIAHRYISYKKLFYLGTFLSFIGCLLLANGGFLFLGLSFFLMKSLVNVCLSMFVTQLFTTEQSKERRIAFLWNYIGMNSGFMVGFLLTGFSSLSNNYYYLFLFMSVLVLISLVLTWRFIKEPVLKRPISIPVLSQVSASLVIMFLLILSIYLLFSYAGIMHIYVTVASLLTLSLLIYFGLKKSNFMERRNLYKFISFSLMAIIFWTFYMLTPVAIMQLIENGVQRSVFGITLAPQWLINIDSIIILIFAPLLTVIIKKSKSNKAFFSHSSNYFSTAFLFAFLGFVILGVGLHLSIGEPTLPLWAILGYLILITTAEIFIAPVSNALVGELIQEPLRGIMTGAWSMDIGIGGLLATTIANAFILPNINKNGLTVQNNVHLQHVCIWASSLLLVFAIMILLSSGKLKTKEEGACLNNQL